MIRIVCDACEREFEVGDEQAGEKVPCPRCGAINRVPDASGGRSEPRPAKAPAAGEGGLPPDEGPEQHICVVRPAMFRAHPFRAIFILLLFVAGIIGAVYAGKIEGTGGQILTYAALLPSLFAVLWAVKWWVSAFLWVRLTISNKRTVREEGIVKRRTSEVLHDHVRNVEIDQSLIQRMFGVGYIGISSAGQDDIEIEVRDIPNPYRVKELIDQYREM